MIDAKKLRDALNVAMEGIESLGAAEPYRTRYSGDVFGILEAICDATRADGDWSKVDDAVKQMKADLKDGSSVP